MVLVVHDVAAGGVRREVRTKLPPLKDAGFRMAVHRLADRILEATLGVGGIAATRILFVMDGRVYMIDQDGADRQLVSSSDHQAMSPAWAPDGRRFAYMEFAAGGRQQRRPARAPPPPRPRVRRPPAPASPPPPPHP